MQFMEPVALGRLVALCAALSAVGAASNADAQVLEITGSGQTVLLGRPTQRDTHDRHAGVSVPPEMAAAFEEAARRNDISVSLLVSVAHAESNFRTDAISDAGAIGVMQLMPDTARELGVNPYDPEENIRGGAAYLRQQLDRFHGQIDLALAAYNAGPQAVTNHGGVPPFRETQAYVARNLDQLAHSILEGNGDHQ